MVRAARSGLSNHGHARRDDEELSVARRLEPWPRAERCRSRLPRHCQLRLSRGEHRLPRRLVPLACYVLGLSLTLESTQ
jgi:hypothetical protein